MGAATKDEINGLIRHETSYQSFHISTIFVFSTTDAKLDSQCLHSGCALEGAFVLVAPARRLAAPLLIRDAPTILLPWIVATTIRKSMLGRAGNAVTWRRKTVSRKTLEVGRSRRGRTAGVSGPS